MKSSAFTPDDYVAALPDDRKAAMVQLRQTITGNLPSGFEETINYGMIGYVVPLTTYPEGYLNNPEMPLPMINLASQKDYIAVYHMGIVTDEHLLKWFTSEYHKYCHLKLNMGKSCIRFKELDQIPYVLIGELASRISPQQWIDIYEKTIKHLLK